MMNTMTKPTTDPALHAASIRAYATVLAALLPDEDDEPRDLDPEWDADRYYNGKYGEQ